jgi:hypothetical protein
MRVIKIIEVIIVSVVVNRQGTRIFFQGWQSGANIFFTWAKVFSTNTEVIQIKYKYFRII